MQDITRLVRLEILDIRNNAFIAITPQIGRMSSIKSLRVDGNGIDHSPLWCDCMHAAAFAVAAFGDRLFPCSSASAQPSALGLYALSSLSDLVQTSGRRRPTFATWRPRPCFASWIVWTSPSRPASSTTQT